MECPVCGSVKNSSKKAGRGFQFTRSLCCSICNAVWNPGCSRLGAAITIGIGTITVVFFGVPFLLCIDYYLSEYYPFDDDRGARLVAPVVFPALVIGIFLIIYGIIVLVGKAGKPTIIQPGTRNEKNLQKPQ